MDEVFFIRLMKRWNELARDIASSKIESSRIAAALETSLEVLGDGSVRGKLSVPFYWAIYYHDGRGAIRAKPGHFLVFYKDPDDDPRIDGPARNYPVRESQVRRLSKKEFFRDLNAGKLIATKRVGPAKAHPFFDEGMRSFPRRAGRLARKLLSEHVRSVLQKEGLLNLREQSILRL